MKTFRYLQAPDGTVHRIKNGFSWPACIFGPLCAFVKRAWTLGFVLLAPVVALRVVDAVVISSRMGIAGDLFILVLYLVVMYQFGSRGNALLVRALLRKGYKDVTSAAA